MTQLFPVALYDRGFHDLVAVIPPNATLSPGSKITASQLGKVPGQKLANGTWAGYNWRQHEPTIDDVRRWALDGANVGLRATHFPGLDIDSLDDSIVARITGDAFLHLGSAPIRVGKAPKSLLMYRTDRPFARMRIILQGPDDVQHLIEMLGEGQQYLVHGTHPSTKRPYEWSEALEQREAGSLTTISREQVEQLFAAIAEHYAGLGWRVYREGDGRRHERSATEQLTLRAPSLEELDRAVRMIPNTDALFPTRDDYIRMGYAIRAAAGDEQLDEGYMIFAEWAGRHASDGRVSGNPETWRGDWRRMKPPYSVGWPWIADVSRPFGYNDAGNDFTAEGTAPVNPPRQRVKFSDRWLADEVVRRIGGRLRFVPGTGRWLVWDSQRWVLDELMLARTEVGEVLHDIACEIIAAAAGDKELAAAGKEAKHMESARTLLDVLKLIQADRSIAVSTAALDADPWTLNTPSGVVDLRTGSITPSSPDQLCTKVARTGPDAGGACPEWKRFLAEATAGDTEMELYLQRLAGYCLTGLTQEQMFAFVWGPGGNGKTVFLNAIRDVLGDYAKVAAMDTFLASNFDRHSTDLADLMGARLVTASETQDGRRWDEQRVKVLTGGEPVKARFMRQDNFTYAPSFKLIFIGNHRPSIRSVDAAMRRRIHFIPFSVTPAIVDQRLGEKLRSEYPAILGWMIEGCLEWQSKGLAAPESVTNATDAYFEDEDAISRWIEERCERSEDGRAESQKLFDSWREWANAAGEYVGSQKRLVQALEQRHFVRGQHHTSRRSEFRGLQLKEQVTFP